jgi:hypothetical protein
MSSDGAMILKVQRPVQPPSLDRVLIYDQTRRVMYEGSMDADLRALMGDNFKMFVEAYIGADRQLVIVGRAAWQEW